MTLVLLIQTECENGAEEIAVPGSIARNNRGVVTSADEPGFCCHNGVGTCVGGSNSGSPCVVDVDCPSLPGNLGTCTQRTPMPGEKGYGTMWFKFVQGSGTSAAVSTCTSNGPALDSIVEVFKAADHSSPEAECNSLISIGCNDDAPNCGSTGRNSRLCLRDLTPGETYYIMVAAKTPNRQGTYNITMSTSCSATTPPCTNCPAGEIEFVDPPNNVVDARRPNRPNSPQVREGIKTIVATGPSGATSDCWTACQVPSVPVSTYILRVDEAPPGTYTIQLINAIPAGAATQLTYHAVDGNKSIGRFFSHPANVDADSQANSKDILSLVDHLNGVTPLPWGMCSGDLNHSGVIGPADIITLIDLLNGNGFAAWYGTVLPAMEGCP